MSLFRNYKLWWNIYTKASQIPNRRGGGSMVSIPFLLDGDSKNLWISLGQANYSENLMMNFQVASYFTFNLTLRLLEPNRRDKKSPFHIDLDRPMKRDVTLSPGRSMDDAEHVMTMFLLSCQDEHYDL